MTPPQDQMAGQETCRVREIVEWAITTRRSVRGFTDEPVPRATIERILEIASRAPSGSNIQPWKVHVLIGAALGRLKAALCAAHFGGEPEAREYEYYPTTWRSPYLERRRKIGWDLYTLAGVARGITRLRCDSADAITSSSAHQLDSCSRLTVISARAAGLISACSLRPS